MALTETEKLLADGLILFGVEKEAIPGIFGGLKTEKEKWDMMDYLAESIKDNQPTIGQEEILRKLVEICQRAEA